MGKCSELWGKGGVGIQGEGISKKTNENVTNAIPKIVFVPQVPFTSSTTARNNFFRWGRVPIIKFSKIRAPQ